MIKKLLLTTACLFALSSIPVSAVEPVAPWETHKAVVKIYTYGLGDDFSLSPVSTGSGVIISEDGFIVTNRHVVEIKDSSNTDRKMPAVHKVCLTDSVGVKPNCSFLAKLVATHHSEDLAVLKILEEESLPTRPSYPYVKVNASTKLETGDPLTLLGYPDVGGPTITITEGTINGSVLRSGIEWFKTDADISFGSSGGAAVNEKGELVALPTELSRDGQNELGYLLPLTFNYSWILVNKERKTSLSPLESKLYKDLLKLTQKQIELRSKSKFSRTEEPAFSVQLPSKKWEFDYRSKNNLLMTNPEDSSSGYVSVIIEKTPKNVGIHNVLEYFETQVFTEVFQPEFDLITEETVELSNINAKKIKYRYKTKTYDRYLIPLGGYLFQLIYDYGEDFKDRSLVEGILRSFATSKSKVASQEIHEIKHDEGDYSSFAMRTNNEWVIQKINQKGKPVLFFNKEHDDVYARINIISHDAGNWFRKLENEELLEEFIPLVQQNEGLARNRMNLNILSKKSNVKLNSNVQEAVHFSASVVPLKGLPYGYRDVYVINNSESLFIITLETKSEDIGFFYKMSDSFKKQLSSFRFGLEAGESPKDTELTKVNNENQEIASKIDSEIENKFIVKNKLSSHLSEAKKIKNVSLWERLKGKIVLKVEDNGEAFYMNPITQMRYFLGKPEDAFSVMREQGVGISNKDLQKIPVANTSFQDNNFVIDLDFAKNQLGKIFLQVEKNGEAWYVNPNDGKRYFLGRPKDAFSVMRKLGLGITNTDFNSL